MPLDVSTDTPIVHVTLYEYLPRFSVLRCALLLDWPGQDQGDNQQCRERGRNEHPQRCQAYALPVVEAVGGRIASDGEYPCVVTCEFTKPGQAKGLPTSESGEERLHSKGANLRWREGFWSAMPDIPTPPAA